MKISSTGIMTFEIDGNKYGEAFVVDETYYYIMIGLYEKGAIELVSITSWGKYQIYINASYYISRY